MTQVLRGNIVHAPKMGELSILEHGYMVLEDGVIRGVYPTLPEELAQAEVRDYGDRICTSTRPSIPCWAWAWTYRCWTG